jgi:threonine/homoserine/homoserine lactone efflux protein
VTPFQFTLAILLLLATPGPTNTLMALGGYERGWVRALPLVFGEIGGYLTVVVPVATLAAPFFEAYPHAALLAKFAAALWIVYLSSRLWFADRRSRPSASISLRQVFVTTILNPKALIIALVIMPHAGLIDLMPWLGIFTFLTLLAANTWIAFGRLLRQTEGLQVKPIFIQRAAATCLLIFAMILATSSLQSLA